MLATSLLDLPPELHNLISGHLSPKCLARFRLMCRDVYGGTFDAFSKRINDKRWVTTDETNLQALVDLAKHPRLSSKLRTLRLDTRVSRSLGSDRSQLVV